MTLADPAHELKTQRAPGETSLLTKIYDTTFAGHYNVIYVKLFIARMSPEDAVIAAAGVASNTRLINSGPLHKTSESPTNHR